MSEDKSAQIDRYKALVDQYHQLDKQIDALLEAHEGHSENMDDTAREQYRQLARQRDDVFNEMRVLEQILLESDD